MINSNIIEFEQLSIMENNVTVKVTTNANSNHDTRLLPFPIEVIEMILMYLDPYEIHIISEKHVPYYVWQCKKDRTIEEAVLNHNLIGLKHLIINENTFDA